MVTGDRREIPNRNYNYLSEQELLNSYNKLLPEPNLYVYVESMEYIDQAVYMASFYKGKLVFDIVDIANRDCFIAWFISPQQFKSETYNLLFKTFDLARGISVLMASGPGELNLLLNRSFYYDDLRINNIIYNYNDFSRLSSETITEKDWIHVAQGRKSGIENQWIERSSFINIFAHGSWSGFSLPGQRFNAFPELQSPVIIAEACSTLEKLFDGNIALNSIKQGAVAYVGSLKVGGANSGIFMNSDSYLLSYSEVPLSTIVKINNDAILKSIDKVPRVVLIGDPLFHYIRETNPVIVNADSIDVSLPFNLQLKKNLYFPTKQHFRSVTNVEGELVADKIVEKSYNTGIISFRGNEGRVGLSTKYSLTGELHKLLINSIEYIRIGVTQVIDNILFVMFMVLFFAPFFINRYRQGERVGNVLTAVIVALLLLGLDSILFGISYLSWTRLLLYILTVLFLDDRYFKAALKIISLYVAIFIGSLMVFIVLVEVYTLVYFSIQIIIILYYSLLFLGMSVVLRLMRLKV